VAAAEAADNSTYVPITTLGDYYCASHFLISAGDQRRVCPPNMAGADRPENF